MLIAVGVLKRDHKKLVMNNKNSKSDQPNKVQLKNKSDLLEQIEIANNKISSKNKVY